MSKFSVNYKNLENKIYKRAYKLSEVSDRIEKVAFDVVRFNDDDDASRLWQIQSADDGDYIVALYDEAEEAQKKTAITWEVSLNKTASVVEIYYKGDPIVKVAASKLGIPSNEISMVSSYLPKKLAESKRLVMSLLSETDEATKAEILKKYPELA